ASWDWIGLYLDRRKYWVGVRSSEPEKLWFASEPDVVDPVAAERLGIGLVDNGKLWIGYDLESEEVHFYSRSRPSQIKWLETFLKDGLRAARSVELPDAPVAPIDADLGEESSE